MLKIEHKLISFVNRYIVHIAVVFVLFTAAYTRFAARNYVGNDFHFLLYDIPGNCGSVLYRSAVLWLTERTDLIVPLLKMVAYCADAGVAIMTCALLGKEWFQKGQLRLFFVLTALLLSPVVLEYSAVGMRMDSVCMVCFLLDVSFLKKKKEGIAMCFALASAILYPGYWVMVFAQVGYMLYTIVYRKKEALKAGAALSVVLACVVWVISMLTERNSGASSYFWGKIWVIDRLSGIGFDSLWSWIREMIMVYGYFAATILLVISIKNKKWRIPAVAVQIAVAMFVGWQQSGHMAL